MNVNQAINRLFLLATAPFVGMIIWLFVMQHSQLTPDIAPMERPDIISFNVTDESAAIGAKLEQLATDNKDIYETIEQYYAAYTASSAAATVMLQQAASLIERPEIIFDNRIAAAFGAPLDRITSSNIDLTLYEFWDINYRGLVIKANLKTDQAMKLALAGDEIGNKETTQEAVNRLGGLAGVNAGGFADNRGKRFPTGNTIQDGRYVYGFFPSVDDLAFVGLNRSQQLIGGKFDHAEELRSLEPQFGVSFAPILIQEGKKQTLPVKWMTNPYRAARTVVGSFRNGQLLFIVADGGHSRSNPGASLAELQDKLHMIGIENAYNLDGGGSTTLVWGDEVINTPSDGKMRSMPTHFVFFE